ncbi:hypothetical protein [Mucilaginibacter sp. SP1R1]|uniref:hypothetical protein n=1 Tax=Mucilaginibacter sp. SP1R1 TaxID=2723091 RepID=UPI00160BF7F1|nr:hypothetical protein [Mucilaginibacter sp. SP1R1]MBB6152393.1 hypothetical protein [Mucilaginibacter sp. SP1R1]
MGAVVINLKDFGVRTPEQVVRIFFELYDVVSVREQLWEVFRRYTVNDENGIAALDKDETRVALLFDHLIDLVGAIEILRTVRTVEKCVVCGRVDVVKL